MTYLLFSLLLVVAVVVTYFVTKKKAFNEGYLHGELSEREKYHCSDDLRVQWDYNDMMVNGINPLKCIDICEKEHKDKRDENCLIPLFGIKTKYVPNVEYPAKRYFDINIYCDYTNKVDKNIKIFPDGAVFDGYHTFDELYYYRLCYNAIFINSLVKLINENPAKFKDIKVCKSKKHFGGELCYGGGWFIVMISTPWGQISNHYKLEYWDMFNCPVVKQSWKWDGHCMKEAMERLNRLSKFIATGSSI